MVEKKEDAWDEDIDYVKNLVLRKFPLLGTTMTTLETKPSNSIETAATDGQTIYYSPDFFKNLNDDEKVFVYAHEVMHVAFNHILRSKGRNQRLWNIATDSVINQILQKEELPLIKGGVDIAEALNHSAEEMYEKLLEKQQEKQQQSGGQDNQNENGGQSEQNNKENEQVGHDSHEIWKKAVEQNEQQQQQQQSSEQDKEQQQDSKEGEKKSKSVWNKIKDLFDSSNKQSENKDENKSPVTNKKPKIKQNQSKKDSSDTSNAKERSKGQESDWEKTFEQKNRQERQKCAAQIRRRLEQQKSKVLKEMSKSRQESLGPVGNSKEVENWKKLLKKTVEEETDRWSYRRSGANNDYMARVEELEDENKAQTEVMLDVSGSVDEEMLKEFLRQLKPILKNSKLKVGCFDERFYGFKEIKSNRDIDNFAVPGGGGTNIDLAVRAFSKKKEVNKIVFTDGYSYQMPKNDLKNVNVIWLIYDNDNFQPVCGKVIYVSPKQNNPYFINKIASRQSGR